METVNKDGIKVLVYAPIGQVSQGAFALYCAARTLEFFSEYFDCAYPLQKMDMVEFQTLPLEQWRIGDWLRTGLCICSLILQPPPPSPSRILPICGTRTCSSVVWQSCDYGLVD